MQTVYNAVLVRNVILAGETERIQNVYRLPLCFRIHIAKKPDHQDMFVWAPWVGENIRGSKLAQVAAKWMGLKKETEHKK